MSVGAHVEELKKRHETLSRQVEEAQRAPGVSDLDIQEMKKQKLKLKEEMAKFEG